MRTDTLMIQGTTSDAGKSTLVAGLGRVLFRLGIRVAPFKPQNMALNSAVAADGGEIGRAQAVQAQACGVHAHSDMNPVLLKPNSDKGSQIIVQGHAIGNMNADTYHQYKLRAARAVQESYERLNRKYEMIIVEGAGSPAEVNLRENDIANMGFAESVDCPVVLIGDIDRGGVFAHLVGTLSLLSNTERARIVGFVINRFRGDIGLLQSGLNWLEDHTGISVLGVLPYLHGLHLEAEDALPVDGIRETTDPDMLKVVVPIMPRISNHTDFDPLRLHPDVNFQFVAPGARIPPADLMILPGSKSVIADLDWLREQGWATAIFRHLRYGGKLIGICGGFQMLGKRVHDPDGIEGSVAGSDGLGLFDMETTLAPDKQLRNLSGELAGLGAAVSGYEIHAGVTTGSALSRPAIVTGHGADGAVSDDGRILGTYLHGLFESRTACDALLRWAGLTSVRSPDYHALREAQLNRLADAVESHLDLSRLAAIRLLPGARAS